MEIKEELLEEFSKENFYVFNKGLRILCIIMFVIQSVALALSFSLSSSFSTREFMLACLALFFLWFFLKGYKPSLKVNRDHLKSLNGKLPKSTKRFYDDHFETSTSHVQMKIEYNKITKIFESDNLVIVMIGKRGVMLLKNGFSGGTFSDFKNFITDKVDAKKISIL